jgi:hypothetical protein
MNRKLDEEDDLFAIEIEYKQFDDSYTLNDLINDWQKEQRLDNRHGMEY